MEISHLRTLLAVLETSSVTRAAEKVSLSPGAVSQQLHALGAGIGVELFVRSGKRIVPTAAALRLGDHARSILHQVELIEQEFINDAHGDTRPFHFASGATSLIYRLGAPLRQIRKRFPQTDMHVTVAATEEIVEGLLSRRFDLGLISLPVDEEKLSILPLYDEELLGLRPAHGRARMAQLDAADLTQVPFLLYPPRSNSRALIDGFFRDLGVSPRVIMEADDTEAIKRLVGAGFGYSLLPEFALRRESRYFQLFRVKGRRLVRRQALALARTEYPRALTVSIAKAIQSALGARNGAEPRG
ncbi:MAG TPA: LysR family transcriptional regulator [Bryobacteraceae bacterium]|jgi:DNA-binding transcriptional LysR family regulator|nr:LysR family transcriptional regulator [Bryobacteraceae bacterium]